MSEWTQAESRFMSEALALARRGEGFVEPNPMVGCVLVRGRRVVGRGWHRQYGGPHAEVEALRQAGKFARGVIAYVTLEPCCHWGKTPPCVDALIDAGVKAVVAGAKDPNTKVAGKGFRRLRAAGIETRVGLLNAEAAALIAPFTRVQRDRRPYFILKWAQSIDGRIATRSGESKWISSPASRREVHELRARVDAIVVGVGTVLADDPELTAREAKPRRMATRVVLDANLRTPPKAKLVRTAGTVPTLIVTTKPASISASARRLTSLGCLVMAVPHGPRGFDLAAFARLLHDGGMTNVLVEGGGRTLGAFVDAELADEARIFVAPILIGGRDAPPALNALGPADMSSLPDARVIAVKSIGSDLCYHLRLS